MRSPLQLLSFLLLVPFLITAQSIADVERGVSFIEEISEESGLTSADIAGLKVTGQVFNKLDGRSYVYFTQTYDDYRIENAVFNLAMRKDKSVLNYGSNLVADVKSKIADGKMSIEPQEAIILVATELGITLDEVPTALKSSDNPLDGRSFYALEDLAEGKISTEPVYHPMADGTYHLAWLTKFKQMHSHHYWNAYISGVSGELLEIKDDTKQVCGVCNSRAGGLKADHSTRSCAHQTINRDQESQVSVPMAGDGAVYRALEFPTESPLHGPFTLADDPSDATASPYGWHDLDGADGAEFTTTRGNNGSARTSDNYYAEGGADLVFDYAYDPAAEVDGNLDADIVNAFYAVNRLHDIMYNLGFDEASGNFQNNNYGNGGENNDDFLISIQDPTLPNNASFGPGNSVDGEQVTLTLGVWDVDGGFARIVEPAGSAGEVNSFYPLADDWMIPTADLVDVRGEIIVGEDSNPSSPTQCCGELANDVTGKIVLIDRGGCEFGRKSLNAQDAGAVGVIICNVPGATSTGDDGNNTINMGGGAVGAQVTIPVTMMFFSDCLRLKAEIDAGPVLMEFKIQEVAGPQTLSPAFDNGIVAHEYGHGIQQRMIGGPGLGTCISGVVGSGTETLSEGAADVMTLMLTARDTDTGADPQSVGVFADGGSLNDPGLRSLPYSTDMSVNPLTYKNISQQGIYGVGEVWAVTMWDLYWRFVDLYGHDQTWTNTEAGNYRVAKLMLDAYRSVNCDPTALDMRDAILATDDGEHTCMIWETFARRGMGFFANAGAYASTVDGTEDFEPLPTCILALKIKRQVGTAGSSGNFRSVALIQPGDELAVKVDVANHTLQTATNVIVTEVLEEGLTVNGVDPTIPFTQNSDNTVTFELGDLASLDEFEFIYTMSTDPNKQSITRYFNSAENFDEQSEWDREADAIGATNRWGPNTFDSKSGTTSWFSAERDEDSDQRLILPDLEVIGQRPVFRFWHRINTTTVENGGIVEVSTDNNIWRQVDLSEFVLGGYNDNLAYGNFVTPNQLGFSGPNPPGDFADSYIDLSSYAGQTISLRWRFGTHDFDPDVMEIYDNQTQGWFVDDAELMNLQSYVTSGSISADNADTQATPETETVIDSDGGVSADDLADLGVQIDLFPNPASDYATVKISSEDKIDLNMALMTVDGRAVFNNNVSVNGTEFINLDLSSYAAGFYLVQLRSGEKVSTKKLIID